jgi:hypothetical protein
MADATPIDADAMLAMSRVYLTAARELCIGLRVAGGVPPTWAATVAAALSLAYAISGPDQAEFMAAGLWGG